VQVVAAINSIELNALDDHEFDIDFKRPKLRNLDLFDFLQYTFGFQVFSLIIFTSGLINHLHSKQKLTLLDNSAYTEHFLESSMVSMFSILGF